MIFKSKNNFLKVCLLISEEKLDNWQCGIFILLKYNISKVFFNDFFLLKNEFVSNWPCDF